MVDATEKPTVIFTDHAATTGIVKQTSLSTSSVDKLNMRLVRASQYLSQFRLDVRYKPGKQHIVPDALSRLNAHSNDSKDEGKDVLEDIFVYHTSIIQMTETFKAELLTAYETDPHWLKIKDMIPDDSVEDTKPGVQFVKRQDLIYHIDPLDSRLRLCIPKALEGDVFAMAHDQHAHAGFHRSYERIRSCYYIRKMTKHLHRYIYHCQACQLTQTKRHKPYGELVPIQSPPVPFHTVTINFILALPETKEGFNAILSVTDKSSKRITLLPGRDNYSAED